jgi:hypothetical protein
MRFTLIALLLVTLSVGAEDVTINTLANISSVPRMTGFTAAPNPASVGIPVIFKATFSKVEAESTGLINFGDGTTMTITDVKQLAEGVSHTYTTAGSFEAFTQISGVFFQSSVFVIVGRGTVINPITKLSVTATDANGQSRGAGSRFAGGVTNLSVNASKVSSATKASTDFTDIVGRATVNQLGFAVSHTYTTSGIFLATTRALDFFDTERAKVRKMLAISNGDAAVSGALGEPASTDIKMKKLSGKFQFVKAAPDSVSFSGSVVLPAGFDVNRADGNTIAVGIGNVIDSYVVDAKGKATLPGSTSMVTKAKVKFPKIEGLSVGGETVQVDFTISTMDLDVAGFDTEGITATLRFGEPFLKAAPRMIQVSLVLGGVAYETLAPVDYKLSKKADAGAINGRAVKAGQ